MTRTVDAPPDPGPAHRDGPRGPMARLADRVPDIVAAYLGFVAIFCLLTALLPFLRAPLDWLRRIIEVISVDAPPNLAFAAFLGILAAAVRRRMRAAWWVVVLYLVVGRVLGVVTILVLTDAVEPVQVSVGGDLEVWLQGVFGVLELALLLLARSRFTARTERGTGWRALGLYVGLVVIGTVVGFGLLTVFPGTLPTVSDRLGWALTHVLGGLSSPDVTGIEGVGPRPITFLCGLLGAVAVLAAAYVLFRPRSFRRHLAHDDEERIRGLLAGHGDADSLGYFATRRDKTAVFSASGKSAVTYRVVSGVSLASGDPLGDSEAWPAAIRLWLDEARYYGWVPAVMGAGRGGGEAPTPPPG